MSAVDIRSLDVGMLRTFDALLAERSVSRAAARLFLSQPAVSSSLKRLRQTFDDPLFVRSAYGVDPTPRALALAPHVHTVLHEMSRLLAAGRNFDPALSDRIFRVVGSDYSSGRVLPRICSELAACGSGIRIFWESANYASLPERLLRGDVDLGVLPRSSRPPGLSVRLLYEDHYVMVARPGRFTGAVSFEDFCAAPQAFLGYGRSAMEDLIDQAAARAGLRRYAPVAMTSFAQMADILTHTDFIAVFPSCVARTYAQRLVAHPLPFDLPPYGLYLCANPRSDLDPGLEWLMACVAENLTPVDPEWEGVPRITHAGTEGVPADRPATVRGIP